MKFMEQSTRKEAMSMKLYPRFRNGKFLSYYIRYDDGRIRSLKTRNKDRALRAFRKIERLYFKNRVAKLCGECTIRLGDYRDEFKEWAEVAQKKSTYRANCLALEKLIKVAGESIFLDRLSLKHVDLLVVAEKRAGNATASINIYLRHARATLRKAVEWGYLQENPLGKVKELPVKRRPPKYFKKAEIAPFVATIKDLDLRRFVTALIATGRRRSELVFLDWQDVDLLNNMYTIRVSKSYRENTYGINSLFKTVLLAIKPKKSGRVFNRWSHPDTWTHKVKEVLREAGYGNFHLHHFRHSYATIKVEEGRSLREIQELLGHADIKATQIYAHIGQDHLKKIGEVNIGPIDLGK